jgi:hypothetical protein
MVYLFGIKQEHHLEPQTHRFAQFQKALNELSLYDDVLAFLSRRGLSRMITNSVSAAIGRDNGFSRAST